jgi:hypothetical protein
LWIRPDRLGGPALRGRGQEKAAVFRNVNANLITSKLSIRIAGVNGINAETAAKTRRINILTESEYARLPEVIKKKIYWEFRLPGLTDMYLEEKA